MTDRQRRLATVQTFRAAFEKGFKEAMLMFTAHKNWRGKFVLSETDMVALFAAGFSAGGIYEQDAAEGKV